jgi:hypothetical protein
LLIGQAPSRSGDPSRPLEGRIGRMLAELAGIGIDEYMELTERTNLLGEWTGRAIGEKGDLWSSLAARERAEELVGLFPGRTAVLLGRNVARAFGLGQVPWLSWTDLGGGRVGVIPHPSGIMLWWNSMENRTMAGRFLLEAIATVR